MSPIQQMLLGVGAVATKTYVDDVFSTFLYKGNGTSTGDTQTINNGINLSESGGMVWLKSRDSSSYWNILVDTVRGANKTVYSNSNFTQETLTNVLNSFNNNGFTAAYNSSYSGVFGNKNNDNVASWTFRKAPGFFDIVTYTGDNASGNTSRDIAHSLGSVPGLILIKDLDQANDWRVYSRSLNDGNNPGTKYLCLNSNADEDPGSNIFANTDATSTHFTVGSNSYVNHQGDNYVAYVFAGGESPAATARSVDFDGSGDYLSLASTTDLNLTGDFTIEFWVYPRSQSTSRQSIIQTGSWGSQYAVVQISNQTQGGLDKKAQLWDYDMNQSMPIIYSNADIEEGQWTHVAFTRSSGTIKIWINGTLDKTATGLSDSIDLGHTTALIGNHSNSYYLNAKLSNFRIVKGTAVYTSSFKPPTEPLTNITNTKLLCCNNSSTTGSTVTPGTITANGDPTASTDSPFDDPAAFVFGDSGSEPIIKCGSYIGNSSADFEVNVGFEPQYIMFKAIDGDYNWSIFDSMRGIVTDGNENYLYPNLANAEYTAERISVTPTGFIVDASAGVLMNENNGKILYVAIRRPDGYVGKPPELGTGVFAMDTGNSSSTIPCFDSTFSVDFGLMREPATSSSWLASARLTGDKRTFMNTNDNESSDSNVVFDSNVGYFKDLNSDRQAWMWKRHSGMDCTSFLGTGSAQAISHTMNGVPEFIILKNRGTNSNQWYIYHKDLNNGSNPEDYYQRLGQYGNYAEAGDTGGALFNSTAPTSTHFSVGTSSAVNESGVYTLALLFRSISGISKVGKYEGNGSSSGPTITLGFAPRLIILKATDRSGSWFVIDSLRGIGSGSGAFELNTNAAQGGGTLVSSDSTSFTITSSFAEVNDDGKRFIYYAHA